MLIRYIREVSRHVHFTQFRGKMQVFAFYILVIIFLHFIHFIQFSRDSLVKCKNAQLKNSLFNMDSVLIFLYFLLCIIL